MQDKKAIKIIIIFFLVIFLAGTFAGYFNAKKKGENKVNGTTTENISPSYVERISKDKEPFEKVMLEELIKSYEHDIEVAQFVFTSAYPKKPEMFKIAEETINTRKKEIEKLKGLLKDWYNIELPKNSKEEAAEVEVPKKNSL